MPADSSQIRALSASIRATALTAPKRAGTAVIKAVADTKRAAQVLAPVDTGFLRSSISGTTVRNTKGAVGEVGPTAEYGGYVELGTSKMAPQPYLAPAFDQVVPSFLAALGTLGDIQ